MSTVLLLTLRYSTQIPFPRRQHQGGVPGNQKTWALVPGWLLINSFDLGQRIQFLWGLSFLSQKKRLQVGAERFPLASLFVIIQTLFFPPEKGRSYFVVVLEENQLWCTRKSVTVPPLNKLLLPLFSFDQPPWVATFRQLLKQMKRMSSLPRAGAQVAICKAT